LPLESGNITFTQVEGSTIRFPGAIHDLDF